MKNTIQMQDGSNKGLLIGPKHNAVRGPFISCPIVNANAALWFRLANFNQFQKNTEDHKYQIWQGVQNTFLAPCFYAAVSQTPQSWILKTWQGAARKGKQLKKNTLWLMISEVEWKVANISQTKYLALTNTLQNCFDGRWCLYVWTLS